MKTLANQRTIGMKKHTLVALLSVGMIISCGTAANAAIATYAASAPATSAPDIVNFATGSGDYAGLTVDYGQTFTTGSNSTGYTINSVTIQQTGFGLVPNPGTISVGTLSGTTFTALYSEAFPNPNDFTADQYWTYTFDTPYDSLAANTTYAFELQSGRAPNVHLNASLGSNTSFSLAEGLGTTNTVTLNPSGFDLSFSLDLTANPPPPTAPEPSSLLLAMLGMVGLVAGRRRRR